MHLRFILVVAENTAATPTFTIFANHNIVKNMSDIDLVQLEIVIGKWTASGGAESSIISSQVRVAETISIE